MPTFETELKTYQKLLPELLQNEGKFVVINGEKKLGIYDTYSEALSAGYKEYGANAQFFVQKITPVQTVAFVTRSIVPCQT
jgi:hypothetical protein